MTTPHFDLLPREIQRFLQESDIIGGMADSEIEAFALWKYYGLTTTLELMAARDAMEAAQRPTVVGPGATLASRQGVTRGQSTPPTGGGVKKIHAIGPQFR